MIDALLAYYLPNNRARGWERRHNWWFTSPLFPHECSPLIVIPSFFAILLDSTTKMFLNIFVNRAVSDFGILESARYR